MRSGPADAKREPSASAAATEADAASSAPSKEAARKSDEEMCISKPLVVRALRTPPASVMLVGSQHSGSGSGGGGSAPALHSPAPGDTAFSAADTNNFKKFRRVSAAVRGVRMWFE